jgi:hypothetical protein
MTAHQAIEVGADESDFLFDLVVAVEAAGTIGRAIELGLLGTFDPELDEVFYQVVPPSRGGRSPEPDADQVWHQMVRSLETIGGATALKKCRHRVRRIEAARATRLRA